MVTEQYAIGEQDPVSVTIEIPELRNIAIGLLINTIGKNPE